MTSRQRANASGKVLAPVLLHVPAKCAHYCCLKLDLILVPPFVQGTPRPLSGVSGLATESDRFLVQTSRLPDKSCRLISDICESHNVDGEGRWLMRCSSVIGRCRQVDYLERWLCQDCKHGRNDCVTFDKPPPFLDCPMHRDNSPLRWLKATYSKYTIPSRATVPLPVSRLSFA